MATLQQIRDAIAATLSGVAGMGRVHAFERYAVRTADFKSLFLSGGVVNGWIVRRVRTDESQPAIGRYAITHRWQLRGYMGFDDANQSELVFDDLIEDVRAAFRADETLGGVVATTIVGDDAGAQVEDSGPVMFAGVLAHSARLRLVTRHYE